MARSDEFEGEPEAADKQLADHAVEILSHIDQAAALFDAGGGFLAANRAYCALFPDCADLNQVDVGDTEHLRRIAETALVESERPRLESLLRGSGKPAAGAEAVIFRHRGGGWLALKQRLIEGDRRLHLWQDVSDLQNRETQLSRHAAMLDSISYAAVSLIGRNDWQSEINTLIARLGKATEVSRVVIFEVDAITPDRLVQTCRFEWSEDGVDIIRDAPGNQAEDLMTTDESGRSWLQRRLNGEVVQVLVRDLDGYMRAKFASEGILSMVTVPILVDGQLWGHIDFDDCHRERIWSAAEINALKTVAALLAEIMERAQMEEQVNRQREALHQADKMSALGSLLAGVAHELNNPLTVLIGQALLLEETVVDDKLSARAGKIRAAAERCSRIVKIFLAMARQRPTAYAQVRLGQVIDDVLELVGYGNRANGIEIDRCIDPTLPTLWCDKDQLSQLLLNLIINAQQALLDIQGQRLLRVHARPAEQPAGGPPTVVIEVADSGLGIPQALRSRVFEPFYTTKPVGMGTGIGLSLCHGIATSHGGSIEVDDAAEGGALFRVRLPVGQPDANEEARAETKPPAVRAVAATQEVVLIVDDEPEVAEMLAEILSDMGYRTVTAHSGRQALQQLGLQRIALILSDLRMPDLDGFGLYQALAESHPNMIRRLVFITGDTLQNNAPGGALPPGVLVLEKPFLPADVKYVVARLLGTDKKHVLPASVRTH